ncbi:3-oxoacyl-ACP reductase, partial [Streptomyces sp. SID8380]|nr:3-oxoacyl-ACP reductase [Streptomyces sp. SID8380]
MSEQPGTSTLPFPASGRRVLVTGAGSGL